MAKRKHRKLTAEDERRHERIMEMVRERIEYHEARTRAQEEHDRTEKRLGG